MKNLSLALSGALVVLGSVLHPAQAQTWAHPFASNSIWNTPISSNAQYVSANLGVLGGIANDRQWLFQTNSSDPYRPVYQPEGYEKPGVNIWDSLWIPDEPNGNASFLLPDGVTLREYNAIRRPNPSTNPNPVGYHYGDFTLNGDGLNGGHGGSGMSALGGTIRKGEIESSSAITHALKIELDWAVLYRNTNSQANQSGTYRWPANRSDGNFGGNGNGPGYSGTLPALTMGSLLALPKNTNLSTLNLSTKGLKIAQALKDYGAYVVDTTGVNWQWNNGGYTASIPVEFNAYETAGGYFTSDNSYNNNNQLFADMAKIYPLLNVIDNNGPNSIGGASASIPIGQTISIYSVPAAKYVSTDLNNAESGLNPLRAGWATSVGDWEKFRVDDAGGGMVALYSLNNSRYVSADNSRADKVLRASWATSIGDWEKFIWVDRGSGKFALKSNITGKYVSVDLNSGQESRLKALFADSVGTWEEFQGASLSDPSNLATQ